MKHFSVLAAIVLTLSFYTSAWSTPATDLLPGPADEIVIADWHVVGPCLSGAREALTNPFSGSFNPATGEVDLNDTYPSEQAFGGRVEWTEQPIDENGNLVFNFDDPDWEKINDEWGVSGLYFLCAAYAEFESERECRALINAHGIGSFYINGRRYSGDPYGHRLIKTPVILDEGLNRVFFVAGGFGGSDTVRFDIEPPPEQAIVVLDRDILLPDLVRGKDIQTNANSIAHYGEPVNLYAGIPIVNTTNEWIDGVSIAIGDNEILTTPLEAYVRNLPPLSVVKVPVNFIGDVFPEDWEEDTYEVPIRIWWDDQEINITSSARVRDPEDSRRMVFLSDIDNSVQKYAVRFPSNYDPTRNYSLILALHGAGVECDGMVDSFESRDSAFIVAPTNRRRFGFDWQDWGRLDALEVLEQCNRNYRIDPNRVYLVGHSMGGHGTWHVGSTHADRFAAIVPSAGWASFQLYSPWFLRADELFGDPNLRRIVEACTSPDRTERLLPNLRNTPVLAVHGGDDDNVPPTHGRLLTGILDRMDYDVRYWEEPGQGHWWDNDPNIPGAGCVDALRIRSFLMERERNPYPRHVTLATYDLGNANERYWIEVNEEISPIGQVYVDAELERNGDFRCTTANVRMLTFDFSDEFPYSVPYSVEIDNQVVVLGPDVSDTVSLTQADGLWTIGESLSTGTVKTPDFRGPVKRAYMSPFVIVVGTQGTDEANALNMEIARAIQQRWWYRANGYSIIVPDTDTRIGDEYYQTMNLVLVGGPDSNVHSRMFEEQLPISIVDGGVMLGDKFIEGDDLSVKFVYPNPANPDRLILCNWGTSLAGTRLAGGMTCLFSGSNLPDFLIYDDDVRLMGYAGVRASGFFDNNWELDEDLYYLRY